MVILIMRKLYTLLGIALLFINLCGCSNNKIARILEENGYSNVNIEKTVDLVLCQDNGHIKPLFFSKISKMHKLVAFIPRFA